MRQATRHDIPNLTAMMHNFRKESGIAYLQEWDNEPYFHKLLEHIIAGAGAIFYEEGKGVLIALITPTVWCDKTLYMQELAWYVKPEYRNTTLGYRLLKQYIELGKKLKASGRIKFFCMAKLQSSPDIKYDKFGFRKLDDNWMQ